MIEPLAPIDQGISHSVDGAKVAKYPTFIINANGTELPVIPSQEWTPIAGDREMPLTDIPDHIEGVINIPAGLTLAEFDKNYDIAVCAEYVIDREGHEVAARYETHITSPISLGQGFVVVPDELKNADPATLQIRFSFVPGTDSRTAEVEVVRKDDIR